MKTNLKNFPDSQGFDGDEFDLINAMIQWFEDFEAELRERLRRLESYYIGKEWVLCEIDFIKEILGDD